MPLYSELRDILWGVQRAAGDNFTGIGLLVTDAPETLPIISLRHVSVLSSSEKNLIAFLASISVTESPYHDGFHVISSDWKLTRVSQYFSPPIVAGINLDRSRNFGGRYLAALFGSAIHSVQLAGIASRNFGIAVFKDGREELFEVVL
jgi:hypothetical protein